MKQLWVQNTVAPVVTCPANRAVQCFADVPAPDASQVTATDNCTAQPVKSWVSDAYQTNGCVITITRTYQADDGCGNRSTCTQQITVQDTIAPVITCPANCSVPCFFDVPAPDVTQVTATDNCTAQPLKSWIGDTYQTNGCVIIVTRTY